MTIDIGSVFEDGIDAFLSKKALVLVALFLAVSVYGSIAGDSFGLAILDWVETALVQRGETIPPEARGQFDQTRGQFGWGFDVGLVPAVALLVISFLVGELARIGAIRALVDDTTDSLERSHYLENVASIFLHRVLVAIIAGILLAVTMIVTIAGPAVLFPPLALIGLIPFLYVAIGLYFASFAVTIDEVDALDGISRSWSFAKGNRLRLVLIALGVGIVTFVIGLPTFVFADLDAAAGSGLETTIRRTPLALVVTALVGGVNAVFRLAVAAWTYEHLADDDATPDGPAASDADQFASETQF